MNEKVNKLANLLIYKKLKISIAESCTGGSLSSLLTKIPGASNYFDRAYITYCNKAKIQMLNVDAKKIDKFGSVSDVVALEMARGVLKNTNSDVIVAITGVAGPSRGSEFKPVGMVCFAFIFNNTEYTHIKFFQGSRDDVISKSIDFVLNNIIDYFESHK